MSKIVELFGIQCDSGDDVSLALKRQICPFTGKRCFKTERAGRMLQLAHVLCDTREPMLLSALIDFLNATRFLWIAFICCRFMSQGMTCTLCPRFRSQEEA